MRWISDNYKWLLDGVGGAAIIALFVYLLQRWVKPSPRLNAEIREVCFDDVLESVTEDWADFTLERYIFVYVWAVNTESVATAVKDWKLTYLKDGKTQV